MENINTKREIEEILQSRFGIKADMHDYAIYFTPSGSVRDHDNHFRTTREKMKYVFPIESIYDLNRR